MSVDVSPAALLAGFRSWLAVERGLSRETVRCYNNQAGTFLASLPDPVESAVRQLDSGQVTSFMVGYCRDRYPQQMSGGEQQRVAIATACANDPRLLLADEPTGELDSHTAGDVFGALRAVNRDLGTTVLIVTHDIEVVGQVDRTISIRNGRTSMETLREAADAGRRDVEYAVLDRNGRLQLPARMTERLGMRDRVRLDERTDHIAVRPGAESSPLAPSSGEGGDAERTELGT